MTRSKAKCHTVTIIIDGGDNTLEVIRNDLEKERPVVIIQGSGRLANVLGTLLETSNKNIKIKYEMKNVRKINF